MGEPEFYFKLTQQEIYGIYDWAQIYIREEPEDDIDLAQRLCDELEHKESAQKEKEVS